MKLLFSKKVVISISTILIVLGSFFFVGEFKKHKKNKLESLQIDALIALIPQESKQGDFYEVTNNIRRFVYDNSVHMEDEEFYAHWRDYEVMLRKMYEHANGETDKKVHLECSTRTGITERILQKMGYITRSISVHRYEPNYPAHTFFEVYNFERKDWEIHDPDHNVFWKNIKTNERASIEDLVRGPIDDFTTCVSDDFCGEGTTEIPREKLNNYMVLAAIIDRKKEERTLLVNSKGFDLNRPLLARNKMLSYCEFMPKNCKKNIRLFD